MEVFEDINHVYANGESRHFLKDKNLVDFTSCLLVAMFAAKFMQNTISLNKFSFDINCGFSLDDNVDEEDTFVNDIEPKLFLNFVDLLSSLFSTRNLLMKLKSHLGYIVNKDSFELRMYENCHSLINNDTFAITSTLLSKHFNHIEKIVLTDFKRLPQHNIDCMHALKLPYHLKEIRFYHCDISSELLKRIAKDANVETLIFERPNYIDTLYVMKTVPDCFKNLKRFVLFSNLTQMYCLNECAAILNEYFSHETFAIIEERFFDDRLKIKGKIVKEPHMFSTIKRIAL